MQLTAYNKDYLETIFADIRRAAKYPIKIEYASVKQLKTKSQLGFIFGGLMGVLKQYFFDTQGELWDIEDLKDMLYLAVGTYSLKEYPNGFEYPKFFTLSKMTKDEASEFISKALEYMETLPDLIIPPDLRNCWLMHISEDAVKEALEAKLSVRSPEYLSFQRKQTCLHCGKYGCEVHHVKSNQYGGIAEKSPDFLTISLCHSCHIGIVHQQGQAGIIAGLPLYGFEIETYCRLSYLRWLYKRNK